MLLEGGTGPGLRAENGHSWRCICDSVMGGVSTATLERVTLDSVRALRMTGDVSLQNNGGFVQMSLDLAEPGAALDASGFSGLSLWVLGNNERYNIHLRSPDMTRVWQSWRAEFTAPDTWTRLDIPFTRFHPHRTELPVNPARLARIGLVAIGREMRADLALSRLELTV
ncbi:CIA30 family protein [Roseinatronobacter monicus]|uniref:CIA30 family protein n=1 Tax=Roseinatronobacter monicus TaxID=393481 RepID=UPI003F33F7B1